VQRAHPPKVPEGGLVLEHVAEELLHGRGADGLLEVDALHVGGGHGLQGGEGQQQPGEPRALHGPQHTISPIGVHGFWSSVKTCSLESMYSISV
jgi:hypothetical protein